NAVMKLGEIKWKNWAVHSFKIPDVQVFTRDFIGSLGSEGAFNAVTHQRASVDDDAFFSLEGELACRTDTTGATTYH
ncbi:MAG: hypothetical protein VST67_08180, partial [Nitrospirota bacterium]|nr:hypothetical protein [Nitrospirota bacterium]